jgi:hypothetical protein
VAKLLIEPSAARDRLTAETYLPKVESEAVGALELALRQPSKPNRSRPGFAPPKRAVYWSTIRTPMSAIWRMRPLPPAS